MGMENRQRVQQYISLGEVPDIDKGFGVAEQVLLAQHCPLGPARGARGIEERGQILCGAVYGVECVGQCGCQIAQRAAAGGVHGFNSCASRSGDGGQCADIGRITHQQSRTGVADEVIHLGGGVAGVERQKHQPRLNTGRIKRQRIGRFPDLHRHTVARYQSLVSKRIGIARGRADELIMGDGAPVGQDQKCRGLPDMATE